jgi:hypothetical protein
MALKQVTQQAEGHKPFCKVSDWGMRVASFEFDLGKSVAASNKQMAANEMLELMRVEPEFDFALVSVRTSAATTAVMKLSVLGGEVGKDVATRYAAASVLDLLSLPAAAAGTVSANTIGLARPAAERTKTSALALRCTTASSAAETAKVYVDVVYYRRNLEG